MIRRTWASGRTFGLAVLLAVGSTAPVAAQLEDAQERQRMYYEIKPGVVYIWASARAFINVAGPVAATVDGIHLPDETLLLDLEAVMASTGSGWIITPDGYAVTNGHVVQLFQDQNEQQLMGELLFQALDESGFFALQEAERGGILTNDEKIRLMQRLLPFAEMQVDKDLAVYTQNWQRYPAEVKEYSPAIFPFEGKASIPGQDIQSGKDVAILKIEGRDLPTLPLGDSDAMRIGENVHLAGYPAVTRATWYGQLNPQTEIEASFTSGTVNSVKMDVKGSNVIQYDAATSAGSSGGPLFNDRGEVIGMATMGAEPGFFFAVPTSVVNEFIRSAGVTPTRGMFDRDWSNALDLHYAGDFEDAIPAFDQTLRVMPNLRDALELRREAMAGRGGVAQPGASGGSGGTPILIGIAVLSGLVLLGWGFAMRRRAADGAVIEAVPVDPPTPIAANDGGSGRLVVQAGPLQGNRFPLPESGLKIGRDPSTCQIVISEGTVSREHAIVVPNGSSEITIRNLSGTNPTYVNDRAVQETTVRIGDRIKIGNSVLHYEQE
ncbi:MAG: trypsin-like peptidase domain-containing protein [Gemmatimonadetes bacterium]|nr:trypsin-like peptidase domain-containing protein [Gemmatimonadota bacterium]